MIMTEDSIPWFFFAWFTLFVMGLAGVGIYLATQVVRQWPKGEAAPVYYWAIFPFLGVLLARSFIVTGSMRAWFFILLAALLAFLVAWLRERRLAKQADHERVFELGPFLGVALLLFLAGLAGWSVLNLAGWLGIVVASVIVAALVLKSRKTPL